MKFDLAGNRGLAIFESGYSKFQGFTVNEPGDATAYDQIERAVTAGSSSLTYDSVAHHSTPSSGR